MKILADENIPGLEDFAARGELHCRPGDAITRAELADVEVLLVRSVTPVGPGLLEGTPVRFVGSATIGTDHVDLAWLQARGIGFVAAPGCNAMSVAEYVLQAVLRWLEDTGREPADCRAGIVGVGNVGGRVAALLRALGMEVVGCDPPRRRASDMPDCPLVSLNEALAADVVSLHVPLVREGPDATVHRVGQRELAGLGDGQLLINSSRGPVVDNRALHHRLLEPAAPRVVLDVWEGEPRVHEELARLVWLGTPHVAGYSVEGKLRGTRMLLEAFCRWQGLDVPALEVAPASGRWTGEIADRRALLALLRHRYRIEEDHQGLMAALEERDPAAAFRRLRRDYPPRHELAGLQVCAPVAPGFRPLLRLLGVSAPRPDGGESATPAPDGGRPPVSWPR